MKEQIVALDWVTNSEKEGLAIVCVIDIFVRKAIWLWCQYLKTPILKLMAVDESILYHFGYQSQEIKTNIIT